MISQSFPDTGKPPKSVLISQSRTTSRATLSTDSGKTRYSIARVTKEPLAKQAGITSSRHSELFNQRPNGLVKAIFGKDLGYFRQRFLQPSFK
jgi:hypothetical protein